MVKAEHNEIPKSCIVKNCKALERQLRISSVDRKILCLTQSQNIPIT